MEGYCTEQYIRAIEESIERFGSYVVIAPGVAIPHARVEKGSLKTGASIVTLETPRRFGSKDNDPVDIVIAFSAIDKNSHLKMLQKIALLIDNATALKAIRAAQSNEALLTAIQSAI
ncbi:Ascorbate-specific phosphotransferase enzyme IIA component [Suttonella ornithocola]|uniref:Ascorbate-specific PTS system EIIA component n=2 Tax=Suttonella ornithocola TaxID=279832 RepID=A0A380MLA8_9GAMM|nr:Ascorbate-specific phosphotransferase enzyme IIA component [Suttonella ornithocola]